MPNALKVRANAQAASFMPTFKMGQRSALQCTFDAHEKQTIRLTLLALLVN